MQHNHLEKFRNNKDQRISNYQQYWFVKTGSFNERDNTNAKRRGCV